MKFWELISAFRSEKENLNVVLGRPKWKRYKVQLENFDKMVRQQKREILDEKVPFQLSKEVCENSAQQFYLYYKRRSHIITKRKKEVDDKFEMITALDILLRYGGQYLEQILEKGIIEVNSKQPIKKKH